MSRTEKKRIRVGFVNLGCAKNSVDSEIMETILIEKGFSVVRNDNLDVVVINTCGFIEDAKEESLGEIFRIVDQKKRGKVGKIIVGGCLSQRYLVELKREIPEVDRFFGIDGIPKIGEILWEVMHGTGKEGLGEDEISLEEQYLARVNRLERKWSYLKILDGCSHFCTYCTIPVIRGPLKSREVGQITSEFKAMIRKGIKEINLIGHDIGAFGAEVPNSDNLEVLLTELSAHATEDTWVRLLYLHPTSITDRLVEIIAKSSFIVNYLDIPVQHASNRILKKMNRDYTSEYLYDLFALLRGVLEGLVLRTTLMVGFPGESREDFEQLLDLVEDIRFDRLGGFLYSREEGTIASEIGSHVGKDEAISRLDELLTIQSQISLEKNHHLMGKRMKILVEEVDERGRNVMGRYYGQAPEEDGVVSAESCILVGKCDFITVEIIGCDHYDLQGKVIA